MAGGDTKPVAGQAIPTAKESPAKEPPRTARASQLRRELAADSWLDFQLPKRGPDSACRPISRDASFKLRQLLTARCNILTKCDVFY